ncbi:putative serine/threonine-protein kinase [Sesbania bispinosa]|nr:putative serine/threonine-protein kinase [Sesbania bispinosa]
MNFTSHTNLITVLLILSCFGLCLSSATNMITSAQFIRDTDTLSSNNSDFKLGFFSPENSTNRYVGIWYLSQSNVIWVANRNQPLPKNSSGIVKISEDGNLVVLNSKKNKAFWSTNVAHIATNSTAKLLDTGNLVLLDGATGEVIWESFQHPCDIYVPKMKLSINRITEFGIMGLNPQGQLTSAWWKNRKELWRTAFQGTSCDLYGMCGAFGSCNWQNTPICSCLNGYKPRNLEEWNRRNWTGGCVRKEVLQCGGEGVRKDGFLKLQNMKVPDFVERLAASLESECRDQCLENCSCVAYAYESGIGCMVWSGDLIDIQRFSSGGGVDLYIRVAHSVLEKYSEKRRDKRLIIAIGVTIGMITLAGGSAYLAWKWTAKSRGKINSQRQRMNKGQTLDDQLPLFNFEELATATNNFHPANVLGKGGFGPVYKGQLKDGQEIAVKRLSKTSGQGLEECMNEILVISKLQHRNLVRVLGCCIEQEERMLIYEYMPNKSLDALLFDPVKKKDLDWPKRFNIIEGISRDGEMNPKISDFGMARIFGGHDLQANTRRVVGTFGYMPPEYAFRGLFSEKSDVFSFGVLLLEIISGKKISSYYDHDLSLSLLGFAWKLWNEKDIQSLIDQEICNPDYMKNILRCIHIGLLCVQEVAKERPTVATVVSMLNSEIVNLPLPSYPAFIERQIVWTGESSQQNHKTYSINNVTITDMQGR